MPLESYLRVEDAISTILEEVDWSQKINWSQLARDNEIPYQRLLQRAHGRQSRCERPGTNKVFTEEQEESIHIYL